MELLKQYKSLNPVLEMGKAQLEELALQQAGQIIDSGSAEIAFAALTKFEQLIKTTKNSIKESALFEIEQGRDTALGCKLSIMNATRYDYSLCGDPEWTKAKDTIKEREAFLKGLKKPIEVLAEGGELIRLLPPAKKITETVKVKVE